MSFRESRRAAKEESRVPTIMISEELRFRLNQITIQLVDTLDLPRNDIRLDIALCHRPPINALNETD
jgi:hypothetical protein